MKTASGPRFGHDKCMVMPAHRLTPAFDRSARARDANAWNTPKSTSEVTSGGPSSPPTRRAPAASVAFAVRDTIARRKRGGTVQPESAAAEARGTFASETKRQTACKPGSVRVISHAGRPFLWDAPHGAPHATNPGGGTGMSPRPCRLRQTRPPLFGLAPGGVYPAAAVTGGAGRSYRPVSPLPIGYRP